MKAPREKLINESYLGFIPIKFKLFQQRTQEREMSGRKINQECFKRNRMILVRVDSARSVWYLTHTHTHTHAHLHLLISALGIFFLSFRFRLVLMPDWNGTAQHTWLLKIRETQDRWKRTLQTTVFRTQRTLSSSPSSSAPMKAGQSTRS